MVWLGSKFAFGFQQVFCIKAAKHLSAAFLENLSSNNEAMFYVLNTTEIFKNKRHYEYAKYWIFRSLIINLGCNISEL